MVVNIKMNKSYYQKLSRRIPQTEARPNIKNDNKEWQSNLGKQTFKNKEVSKQVSKLICK